MTQDSSTSFSLFPKLPLELRLVIWESVPQPTRLIGQVACAACSGADICKRRLATAAERRQCIDTRHPDWRLKYIVLPSEHAIFPPLHACRESRGVWLPRYYRPPRYISLRPFGFEPDDDSRLSSYSIRFDVPFISYETDVFTCFQPWTQADIDIGGPRRTVVDRYDTVFDPFLGLDRSRLQQIAIGEGLERVVEAAIKLDLPSLPSVRKVFALCFGPDPRPLHSRMRLQIPAAEVQHFDCDFYHIPNDDIDTRHILKYGRLRHPRSGDMGPLLRFLGILKALLWHAQHTPLRDFQHEESGVMYDFDQFVRFGDSEGPSRTSCPLRHVAGCGPTGHTHKDMMSWVPPFKIRCMMLYQRPCEMDLDGLPLFHTDMPEDEWDDML